jgi:enhancing lycopene biosynthesis protein 2
MSTTQNYKGKRIAVVLSGCGVYDGNQLKNSFSLTNVLFIGSETTEAVSILTALSRAETTFQCYAPNKAQHHVINHLKGEEQI